LARHQFAFFVLAAIALTSSFWLMLDVVGSYNAPVTGLTVDGFENRFEALHKALPPHSVLGYVSDNQASDPSYLAEYYLTQYTLAPVIVKPTSAEALVVFNYHTPKPDEAVLRTNNLIPVQAFENGVMLCRRVKQQ